MPLPFILRPVSLPSPLSPIVAHYRNSADASGTSVACFFLSAQAFTPGSPGKHHHNFLKNTLRAFSLLPRLSLLDALVASPARQ